MDEPEVWLLPEDFLTEEDADRFAAKYVEYVGVPEWAVDRDEC